MDEDELIALAEAIAACLCGQHEHLCLMLIRHLANGHPVSLTHLAAEMATDERSMLATLRHIPDVEYDSDGNIIAFGLSLQPTNHQFTLKGQSLYTWCALDTFMYTALLCQPAQVVSRCPMSGLSITLTMTPDRIEALTPASCVISLVLPARSIASCRRSDFCNYGHFFATAEDGARWQKTQPDAILLPVVNAHILGRLVVNHRLRRAKQEATRWNRQARSLFERMS